MNKREEVRKIKKRIASLPIFDNKCFVCECKKNRRGFTFHHLWYIDDDVVYSDYKNNLSGQLQYYQDLEPLIHKNPKRFLYVCNPHHQAIERMKRWGKNLERLLLAVRMTKT